MYYRFTLVLLFPFWLCSQVPTIEWEISLGGSLEEEVFAVQQTADNGFIVAGSTFSSDGDITINQGNWDYWIVKLSPLGSIEWQKTYGGSDQDRAYDVKQTLDGGFIVVGDSRSNDGDVSVNNGNHDFWILKLDQFGSIIWEKSFGQINQDNARSVQQTSDGGFIIAGHKWDLNIQQLDLWIIKLNNSGILQWQQSFGGFEMDRSPNIIETSDGGYFVNATSDSDDQNVSGSNGQDDYYVLKLNSFGAVEWQNCYGGSGNERNNNPTTPIQTIDGGYIIGGYSGSSDGDVTENKGYFDAWILKLSSAGNIEWQKSVGSIGDDSYASIIENGNNLLMAGSSALVDGDVTHNNGGFDYWLTCFSNSGTLLWDYSYGGSGRDIATEMQATSDGGSVIVGTTESNDIDVSANHGDVDIWVVKLSPTTDITELNEESLEVIKIYDSFGRELKENLPVIYFQMYSDGTVKKVFRIAE
jgi:hypothetical protein